MIHWLKRFAVPLGFVCFVVGHLYCLAVFADDLNWFRVNKIYDPAWTFGQIVAILIWAPLVVQYFWDVSLEFRKYGSPDADKSIDTHLLEMSRSEGGSV